MRNAVKRAGKLAWVAGATLALLAGCSSLNPFASPPRNPPAALVEFKPSLNVHTAWSTGVGKAGVFIFSPAFASGAVFAAAADGSVTRLDTANGHQVWRINADTRLTSGVGTDGHTVAVAGEKGAVLAFDADGKLRWKAQMSSEVLAAPTVGQGLVIVRSVDNRIVAFDAESGSRRWTVQRTAPALTLRTASGIVIAGPSAFVGLPGGRLLALALSNGGPRWEISVGDPKGATELERVADISGAPVVIGRDVCAVSYQGRVGCFDAATGAAHWTKDLSSDVGLGADERFIFAADEHGAVAAFTREGGASVWRNKQLANRRLSAPISFGRAVAVGDGHGYIHFLSREDGSFLARVSTDGSPIVSAPLMTDTQVIFQTQSGTVIALAIE